MSYISKTDDKIQTHAFLATQRFFFVIFLYNPQPNEIKIFAISSVKPLRLHREFHVVRDSVFIEIFTCFTVLR